MLFWSGLFVLYNTSGLDPATGPSCALTVAPSECSGERSADSFISAPPQDSEWRTSSLGRTGAFIVGLVQASEDLNVSI